VSLNPLGEVKYRLKLASEHLERAERAFTLNDWVAVVSSAQLAVENFAKAVIAVFEVPTWSHDPSSQLLRLLSKAPSHLSSRLAELATLASEVAPEHGRAAYGEPSRGLTPADIYRKEHAADMLSKARRAKALAEEVLSGLGAIHGK